jgi:TonB family protein
MVYTDGKLNGELKGYFGNGYLRRFDIYKDGTLVNGQCFTQTGYDTAYYIYQRDASYKNLNINEYRDYVQEQLIYPARAADRGKQGTVFIQFEVNENGQVANTKILKSPDDLLSRAVLDVVLNTELWEPAVFEGQKVKQRFTIPIIFQLFQ